MMITNRVVDMRVDFVDHGNAVMEAISGDLDEVIGEFTSYESKARLKTVFIAWQKHCFAILPSFIVEVVETRNWCCSWGTLLSLITQPMPIF